MAALTITTTRTASKGCVEVVKQQGVGKFTIKVVRGLGSLETIELWPADLETINACVKELENAELRDKR